MTRFGSTVSRSALALVLLSATSATAGDLSKYRNFQLGTDPSTVAKGISGSESALKVVHSRPALIQELEWRPQTLGPSPEAESAQEIIFSFYNGTLFRIEVKYDRYETEGLTAQDLVGAISTTYGLPAKLAAPAQPVAGSFGDQEETLAQWEDPQYRFDLLRTSYGPSYRLIGNLKSLEAPARNASLEAKRLDDLEAPQRDAARIVTEQNIKASALEKARLINKPKFRP